MTNTIPNVPRELLERAWRALANSATGREIGAYLDADPCAPECAETCARASMCSTCSATLSAPSPAGVDGLEVFAWSEFDGEGGHELRLYENNETFLTDWLARNGDKYADWVEPLCRLSDATSIIDGLRGETERLQMQLAACGVVALANTIESAGEARQMHPDYMSASCSDVAGAVDREIALRTERDQHAQRIGELEGLLRAESARVDFLDAYIVTADAPDTGKAAMLADSGTLRECIDAALSAGKEGE